MIIYPSVLQSSKRLRWLAPFSGLVALPVYLFSVAHCVIPGYSASLVAAAVDAIPPSKAAHPLFSLVARSAASFDIFSLPVRLNLLSAALGVICAMLMSRAVGRTILFAASEEPGGGGLAEMEPDDESTEGRVIELPPEVDAYNRLVVRLALCGGAAASVLFIFSVPVWAAATRLDNGLFSLMLGLAAVCLFPAANERWRDLRLSLSALFFTAGLFESSAFVLMLPCYAYFVFRTVFLESGKRLTAGLGLVLGGLLGAAVAVAAFRQNVIGGESLAFSELLQTYVRELWQHHVFETRAFFPQQGWLFLLMQVGLPVLIFAFGLPTLFKEKTRGSAVVLVLLAFSVAPALLNMPVSLYQISQLSGHLPVFGAAVVAAAAAMALSACLMIVLQEPAADAGDGAEQADAEEADRAHRLHAFVGGVLLVHALVCAAALWRSFGGVNNRQGAFADQVAREMLGEMRSRTCLVTNGLLDNHLKVQACMLGKPLTLVTLRDRPVAEETEALRRLINDSPLFEGLNRVRLQNALSISPVRFVMEWLGADARAAEKVMLFVSPDVWTACGYRALPEGAAFGGLKERDRPDLSSLVERNRAFVERASSALAAEKGGDRFTSGLRMMLMMKVGFAANELGTLLEDYGEWEAAYLSYERAVSADPHNVSAAVNCYELVRTRRLHPEAEEPLKKKMRNAVAAVRITNMQGITWALQNYGSIRQQAFFQQQTAVWSMLGSQAVAAEKMRKALSLSERTGVASLVGDAATYQQAGNMAKAEACYAAALEKDAANRDALVGLCTLKLGQKKSAEAEALYRQASEAGVDALALRYQAIMLAILKGEKERALKLLEAATKAAPADARYWALLADLMLERGDFQYVERQLLPDMQKAIQAPDHFLVHAVRGLTLRCKGSGFYKEARNCLLSALSRNAALTDIWAALLNLDMVIGNVDFTEADVRKWLGVEPEHPLGNYLMGWVLLSRGALTEAEDFLRRSIERKPTSVACNDLAEDLRQQKRLQDAEKYARKALEIDPGLAPAMDTLACVLYDGGRYEEAAALAKKAVAAKPSCMAFQLSLLRAHVRLGDKAAVARLLNELIEREAAVPEALQNEIKAMR